MGFSRIAVLLVDFGAHIGNRCKLTPALKKCLPICDLLCVSQIDLLYRARSRRYYLAMLVGVHWSLQHALLLRMCCGGKSEPVEVPSLTWALYLEPCAWASLQVQHTRVASDHEILRAHVNCMRSCRSSCQASPLMV
jgi:hypothetical protein